jgi:hypothetical protein
VETHGKPMEILVIWRKNGKNHGKNTMGVLFSYVPKVYPYSSGLSIFGWLICENMWEYGSP